MGCGAGIIKGCENAGWTTFFDQVAYNLVVEILDRVPLNLLSDVFLLFSLEGELDEDLL